METKTHHRLIDFQMYNTYIQGYDNAMAILTESLKKYPQFAEVVREFEVGELNQHRFLLFSCR
jgi:hypothetical protein